MNIFPCRNLNKQSFAPPSLLNLDSNQIFPNSGITPSFPKESDRKLNFCFFFCSFFPQPSVQSIGDMKAAASHRPPARSVCSDSVWDQRAETRLQMRVPVYAEREVIEEVWLAPRELSAVFVLLPSTAAASRRSLPPPTRN